MSVIRKLARPLLAAPFVSGGIETLKNPGAARPARRKVSWTATSR